MDIPNKIQDEIINETFINGRLAERKEIIKIIKDLKNPYPLDLFPKLKLSEFQTHTINDFLCSHLRITLDGFSAEIMRIARENVKQELLIKLIRERE